MHNDAEPMRFEGVTMPRVKDFLTVAAAAEFIGVSKDTLRRWDRAGKLRAHRHPINRYRLYAREELQGFLKTLNGGDRRPAPADLPRKRFGKQKITVAEELLMALRAKMRMQETGDRSN